MLKLIVGVKGSGKTSRLVDELNKRKLNKQALTQM